MTPDDLFNPADLPDDLKWIPAHYRLNPGDPVYLLLAWHWRRVKQSEDTLRAAIVEMKAALDSRLAALDRAGETVTSVHEALVDLRDSLDGKPAQLGAQIDARMSQPIAQAVAQFKALEKAVSPLAANFATSQRRQLLAALLTGLALGVLASVIVLLA